MSTRERSVPLTTSSPLLPALQVRVRRVIRGDVRNWDEKRQGKARHGRARREMPTPKRGRPTLLTSERLAQIQTICHLCCNPPYTFISQYLGIRHQTFMQWLSDVKGFRKSIDRWRAEGMYLLRTKAYKIATRKHGDPKMLRYLLDRLDPQFRPKTGLEVDVIPPNYDRALDRPDIL